MLTESNEQYGNKNLTLLPSSVLKTLAGRSSTQPSPNPWMHPITHLQLCQHFFMVFTNVILLWKLVPCACAIYCGKQLLSYCDVFYISC